MAHTSVLFAQTYILRDIVLAVKAAKTKKNLEAIHLEGIDGPGPLRERIWSGLVKNNQAAFPLPPHGHNPNFKGARAAAKQLASHPSFVKAKIILVGMEAALLSVRELVLAHNKILVVPHRTKVGHYWKLFGAPKGAGKLNRLPLFGNLINNFELVELAPEICVIASVAIDQTGARLSKGFGFGHAGIEIANQTMPALSLAHELMVLPELPCLPDSQLIGFATPKRLVVLK